MSDFLTFLAVAYLGVLAILGVLSLTEDAPTGQHDYGTAVELCDSMLERDLLEPYDGYLECIEVTRWTEGAAQ